MDDTITRVKADAVVFQFDQALAWLDQLSVKWRSTRFGRYRSVLTTWLELIKTKDQTTGRQEFLSIVTALHEIHDLVRIHESLCKLSDDFIIDRICKFVAGPADYRHENTKTSTNRARNAGFELLIASLMIRANLHVLFPSRADVDIQFEGRPIRIECKRPHSVNSMPRRIDDAFRQLERLYATGSNNRQRGLIALDITRLINPAFGIFQQPHESALDLGIDRLLRDFVTKHDRVWQQRRRNPKTVGMVLRAQFISGLVGSDLLIYTQQIVINPIVHAGQANIALARRLHDSLQSTL